MKIPAELTYDFQFCKNITLGHYENFPVASLLIHSDIRDAIFPIYAFARTADDIADESRNAKEAKEKLVLMKAWFEHPTKIQEFENILRPLHYVIQTYQIPTQFFTKLLDAFIYDTHHSCFETWNDMMDYCSNSAQPVGHLILWLHNRYKQPFINYSDAITTALQLANFWQDISVDHQKQRLYIPVEILKQFNLNREELFSEFKSQNKLSLIKYLIIRTNSLFYKGQKILRGIPLRLKYELLFTIKGGLGINKKTLTFGERIFYQRPVLTGWDWLKLMMG
ncbi:MAG: squalene synthase HpnC [Calditrichia bacterium]